MKIEKEKGFFRKFLEWLKTPDEDEIENGEINIKAFKGEDRDIINALNGTARRVEYTASTTFTDGTAKRVDHTASTTFTNRDKKRAKTINEMKAEVETPNMEAKGKKNQILEKYLEEK